MSSLSIVFSIPKPPVSKANGKRPPLYIQKITTIHSKNPNGRWSFLLCFIRSARLFNHFPKENIKKYFLVVYTAILDTYSCSTNTEYILSTSPGPGSWNCLSRESTLRHCPGDNGLNVWNELKAHICSP